jgi:putative FmdB family regulatory protein
MPLYEYRCTHCDEEFEDLVRAGTREVEVACPACGRVGGARRRLSAFAVAGGTTLGSLPVPTAPDGGSGFS